MKINIRIQELKEHIKEKERELREIKEKAIRFSAPKGYSSGTSYEDYDCIHGSKQKVDIYRLAEDIQRLETLIEIDKSVLKMLEQNKDVEEKLGELKSMKEKLLYLKQLGYTTEDASECLYISTLHAYMLLMKYKEEGD